jgi:hypothetical protein
VDSGFYSDCLKRHNEIRAEVGVPSLQWDSSLQESAQSWATKMATEDFFQHSGISGVGENLYLTWGGDKSCLAAVNGFYEEKKNYTPGQLIGEGDFASYGHYTQVFVLFLDFFILSFSDEYCI